MRSFLIGCLLSVCAPAVLASSLASGWQLGGGYFVNQPDLDTGGAGVEAEVSQNYAVFGSRAWDMSYSEYSMIGWDLTFGYQYTRSEIELSGPGGTATATGDAHSVQLSPEVYREFYFGGTRGELYLRAGPVFTRNEDSNDFGGIGYLGYRMRSPGGFGFDTALDYSALSSDSKGWGVNLWFYAPLFEQWLVGPTIQYQDNDDFSAVAAGLIIQIVR